MKYSFRIRCSQFHLSVLALLGFLLLNNSRAFSESQHSDLLENIQKHKKRPPVTDTLTPDEFLFLKNGFFRAEESIQTRFNNKSDKPEFFLPEAITSALSDPKTEDPIAFIFADLSGSLNLKQISKLKEDSSELAKAIREKEPTDRDLRLLALIERAEWMGHILEGKIPPPESLPLSSDEQAFAQFKKAFLARHEEVMKKNQELLKAIDEAKNGNKTQKQVVRSRIDFKSLKPYLQGQVDFGNESLAKDLTQAITWKDEAGNFYHDLNNPLGTQPTRVFVSEKPSENLSQLLGFLGGKSGTAGDGSLTVKANAFTDQNFKSVNLSKKPLLGSNSGGSTAGSNDSESLRVRAQTIIQQNCMSCHETGISSDQFAEAKLQVESGLMPKDPESLTPAEKSTLIQFFSQK